MHILCRFRRPIKGHKHKVDNVGTIDLMPTIKERKLKEDKEITTEQPF